VNQKKIFSHDIIKSFSFEKNSILNADLERKDSNKIQQRYLYQVFDIKLENKKELLK
jgi:hypothetical protein